MGSSTHIDHDATIRRERRDFALVGHLKNDVERRNASQLDWAATRYT
jgi:hypothetical protein